MQKEAEPSHPSVQVHPAFQQFGPLAKLGVLLSKAYAMLPLFEDVELSGDTHAQQREIEIDAVQNRNDLVGSGVKNETRRSVAGHLFGIGELLDQRGIRIRSQQVQAGAGMSNIRFHAQHSVGEDGKIRTITDSLDRIGSVRLAGIEMGCDGGR